jgi:signal transduction histidine kinase
VRRALLRSTGFRLTLAYAGFSALSITLLMGFVYWFSIGYLERQSDETIESDIAGLAEHYRRNGLRELERVIAERIVNDRSRRSYYLFTDLQLRPLMGNIPVWPNPRKVGDGWLEFELHGTIVRARMYQVRGGFGLLVGRDVQELVQFTRLFQRALLIGLGATLALSLLGGAFLSARLLRRVDAINRTARRITEGELGLRMPVRGRDDEIDELAQHLNDMLARIDVLIGSVRNVGDNIAHDLRTPLTRLRNRLESLRQAPDTQLREGIEAVIEDADKLLATFQAQLRIARLHNGVYAMGFEELSLSGLADDAVELYHAVADDAGLRLVAHIEPDCRLTADRDLLFQALANLLDNAIKYTPRGGTVHVTVNRVAAPPGQPTRAYDLTVSDTGPGIPEELHARVLDPFYRVDASRSAPGNGLGLALVKAVADHHKAELRLRNRAPGLAVTLRLPVQGTPPAGSGQGAAAPKA